MPIYTISKIIISTIGREREREREVAITYKVIKSITYNEIS